MNFFPAPVGGTAIALSHAANEPLRSFALFEAFAARHAGFDAISVIASLSLAMTERAMLSP
jgi:hypothetical protein